jgi:uncharacterized LabA/DUF88 family protein
MMERVIAYIDGFNLYHGLKDSGWKWGYWLDLPKLIENLLKPNQRLIKTKYFTSIVSFPNSKHKRQNTYLEALMTLPNLEQYYGHFLSHQKECPHCHRVFYHTGEKMTDVNIAMHIFLDAMNNNFDNGLLVSADSDLGNIVDLAQKEFFKKITVAFPPKRNSKLLKTKASGYIHIGRTEVSKSLLPDKVTKPNGFVLRKPGPWK